MDCHQSPTAYIDSHFLLDLRRSEQASSQRYYFVAFYCKWGAHVFVFDCDSRRIYSNPLTYFSLARRHQPSIQTVQQCNRSVVVVYALWRELLQYYSLDFRDEVLDTCIQSEAYQT